MVWTTTYAQQLTTSDKLSVTFIAKSMAISSHSADLDRRTMLNNCSRRSMVNSMVCLSADRRPALSAGGVLSDHCPLSQ